MIEQLIEWDKELFLFLNGIHSGFWDTIMWWVTQKYTWIPLYAFFLYLIIRNYKWKTLLLVVFIALLITISDQLSLAAKFYFERLRPSHDPALEGMIHIVNGYRGGTYGFFSGHATNSFSLATFLSVLLGKRYRILAPLVFIWALVVSYSRIYLGVHFPGDILAGMITGILIGLLVAFAGLKTLRLVYPKSY